KGNAPEERKLERLFRRPEVTRLIKKSNDFGAGGVSVAIGELTDGLDIYLDQVKTKYSGLNATELAISESQERVSVVVEAKDKDEFMKYCAEENIEVVHVADVTDTARMRMFYRGETIVDLSREFIDSAGAAHFANATMGAVEERNPFERKVEGDTLRARFENNLKDDNVLTQKGLIETFDATIGRSTVLMPFGGKYQRSETQVGVQKLPVDGFTNDASMMAYGFNPFVSAWSPYHGAAYAVVEACAKVVAAGGRYDTMRFSYQEYFERMSSRTSWGKPLSALLGALKMQYELKLPSIGGKDSMSGTFQNINVPPTLIAFGITMVDANKVISTDFKSTGENIYLLRHTPLASYMPNTDQLKANFDAFHALVEEGAVSAAYTIGMGGVAEAVAKMSFGSNVGANINLLENDLFNYNYGSILFASSKELNLQNLEKLGTTTAEATVVVNGESFDIDYLYKVNTEKFAEIYPATAAAEDMEDLNVETTANTQFEYPGEAVERPVVYIPVFPGTNCDYDMAKAFRTAGAEVRTSVFCNLTADDIARSIEVMAREIRGCHVLALAGGFSSGDEPDGSAKFIATVLNNSDVAREIHALIDRKGLIIGICNGFQALVKSGLLPYGRLGMVTPDSPTLFRNNINRHISQMVTTRISTVKSPWLAGFNVGDEHTIAMSHGEGKFVVSEELARELFAKGQVAFQYVDANSNITMQSPENPNGSSYAIEGIISEDGLIIGKMGHTERYEENIFKNIAGNKRQPLFENAVRYFRKK
ncbi:MAG: phosphoribosylformylglycinamidine synthase subunit PurQ, partial [Paludibacteraceae bacterium]|nr:phosphoribosylformylglycinamidine synthase subunit PurQ [Paludibacteraceae bacterium]